MDNFASFNGHLALLNQEDTLLIPLHFAMPLLYSEVLERMIVYDFQNPSNPSAGKMAARCVTSPMLGKPSGHMMARWTHHLASSGSHLLEMNDAEPAILIDGPDQF
jgi:hypothetical protein